MGPLPRAGRLLESRRGWAEATDDELVALTESYGGASQAGWSARDGDGVLVGFVNIDWDGGDHAFLIDTKVRPDHQRRGIGTALVRIAARHAHVDI